MENIGISNIRATLYETLKLACWWVVHSGNVLLGIFEQFIRLTNQFVTAGFIIANIDFHAI